MKEPTLNNRVTVEAAAKEVLLHLDMLLKKGEGQLLL